MWKQKSWIPSSGWPRGFSARTPKIICCLMISLFHSPIISHIQESEAYKSG
ncbi:hypothetical protein Q9966_006514 [Columba livia]|nr:hypothetical protein Q9966_006514 [Columba livia]